MGRYGRGGLMKPWLRITLGAVASLLIILSVGPFFVPVPPLEETVPPQALAGPSSRFVEINGVQIHYQKQGVDDPVFILLHGFGASTFSWREVMGPLSEGGTVIAFDRPAFGLTERPLTWEGVNPYRPEFQVDLTLDLAERLAPGEEVILVGNSAGGTIAMAAALERPDRIKGLVLVDAAVYTGGGSPAWVRPLLHTPQLDHLGPLLVRSISRRGNEFLRRAYHDPSLVTEEVLAGYRQPLRVEHWDRALWELTKASHPLDLDQKTGQVRVPTLVITGDDDRIVPTADSLRLAEAIPGASLAVMEDCGHLPQEECPRQFLEALGTFLERISEEEGG